MARTHDPRNHPVRFRRIACATAPYFRAYCYQRLRDAVKNDCSPLMLVDLNVIFAGEGDVEFTNSEPTFELRTYVDDEFLVDDPGEKVETLAEEFRHMYHDHLSMELKHSPPRDLTVREYMIYVAYQEHSESRVAELFGTAVGTIRSVIGRVNDKYRRAKGLQKVLDELEHLQSIEKDVYHLEKSVLDEVTYHELPVDSTALLGEDNYSYESFAPE